MRAEWPDVLYGDWPSRPSSQWVALASAGAGRCELPAPVRIALIGASPAGFQVQPNHHPLLRASKDIWGFFLAALISVMQSRGFRFSQQAVSR